MSDMDTSCVNQPARCNGGGYDGCACRKYTAKEVQDRQRREIVNEVLEQWIIENGLDRRRDVRREEDRRATRDLIAQCRRRGLL